MNHPDPHTTLHHAPGWFTSSHTGQGQNCLEITHAIPGWATRLTSEISDGDTVRVDLDDSAAGGTGALTVTRGVAED